MTPSTIVVPLDGSPLGETALAPGRDLAARFDADLLLVRATWRQPPDEEEHYLGGLATNLGHDRTSIRAVHGFPAPSIAAIVEDLTSPLLCLATGLLADLLPVVQRHCTPERGTRLGVAWTVWRCGSDGAPTAQ